MRLLLTLHTFLSLNFILRSRNFVVIHHAAVYLLVYSVTVGSGSSIYWVQTFWRKNFPTTFNCNDLIRFVKD